MSLNISVNDLHVANNLEKVYEILNVFSKFEKEVILEVEFISNKLGITPRQIYYYTKAGNYLADLFILDNSTVKLTQTGKFFVNNLNMLETYIIEQLIQKEYIQKYLKKNKVTTKMIYNKLIKDDELCQEFSKKSLLRRASTIHSWVKEVKKFQNKIYFIEQELQLKQKMINRIKELS